MTYRAGVSGPLAEWFPEHDAIPTVTCDVVDCGSKLYVRAGRGGGPPAWLLNKKAPPGWKRFPQPNDKPAQHMCPACRKVSGL